MKKFQTEPHINVMTCTTRGRTTRIALKLCQTARQVTATIGKSCIAASVYVTFFTSASVAAQQAIASDSPLLRLRQQDAVLGAIAFRLITANASLCRSMSPATGAVVHARNQYPEKLAVEVRDLFGFASPVAVEAVVPGSPAELGGLRAKDGVLSVSGIEPPPADGDGQPDTQVRDAFEDRLAMLSPSAPMVWRVLRDGHERQLTIAPAAGCRQRFEVVSGKGMIARNNGVLIQLSDGYFDLLDENELVAVIAHELAHGVLEHRRRLVAAGVSKGLLAEFGRSGRLNRQVEREADRLSVHLLRNAGYDPGLAPLLWERHGSRLGGGPLRSRTHDSPNERARLMRAEIASIKADAAVPFAPQLLELRSEPLR